MSASRFAAVCVPALLAGAAIGHATGGAAADAPVVFAIEARGAQTATGFVVAPGRVVTVAHAVEGRVAVRGEDGVPRRAVVVRRDRELDLALLAVRGIDPTRRTSVSTGYRADSRTFGAARVVVRRDGAARAAPAVIRRRIDARIRAGDGRLLARRPALELRADIRAGDSGAPLMQDGRVAGIVFARSRARAGIAYAVDAAVLARFTR
jgi:Trypsin-like peptidase domain